MSNSTESNKSLASSEWKFGYLKGNGDLGRAATFYEYARENKALCHWVEILREASIFDLTFKIKAADKPNPYFTKLMLEGAQIGLMELLTLVQCIHFPRESFKCAYELSNASLRDQLCDLEATILSGESVRLRPFSLELARYYNDHEPVEYADIAIEMDPDIGSSVYAFVVPWKETSNHQLASQFKKWLVQNRPPKYPEKLKLGQTSGPIGPAIVRLNQLAAYRFHKNGLTSSQARKAGFTAIRLRRNGKPLLQKSPLSLINFTHPSPIKGLISYPVPWGDLRVFRPFYLNDGCVNIVMV